MTNYKDEDDRNYDITNKIFEVLNNTENFEVGMENPRIGRIIAKYKDQVFLIDIKPVYSDIERGRHVAKVADMPELMKALHYLFEME